MSQGYIGYDLQNAIRAELLSRGIYKPVATVLTQVVIDPYDDAFAEPEKSSAVFLKCSGGGKLRKKKETLLQKLPMVSTAESLPHRSPRKSSNWETIRTLAEAGQIVIAAGGRYSCSGTGS